MKSCEVVMYNPDTGKFSKKTSVNNGGYVTFKVGKRTVLGHRYAFECMGVEIPEGFYVDHINGDKLDNRWCNLRAIPRYGNQENRVSRGYCYCKTTNRYKARIQVKGKPVSLGYYDTPEEAHSAYLVAKKVYHFYSERQEL